VSTLFVKYEEPTIRAFFPPGERNRFVQLLGKANRRRDGLKILHHTITFDPKWSSPLEANADIAGLLRSKGAGTRAYLIGTSCDGQILPLDDAVAALEHAPGILVCTPGLLAVYSGIHGEGRRILERGILLRSDNAERS
jgi:hypothetical protein